jgi:signal transduction histidine kinase
VIAAAATAGWAVAAACGLGMLWMRRRLERVADAEHELRGALTAFGLGVHGLGRTAAGRRLAMALETELERARSALADLSGARPDRPQPLALERMVRSAAHAWQPAAPGRRLDVDWRAGGSLAVAPAGRVAQVLGNLVANAVEHGHGPVGVRAVPARRAVRVEVSNAALRAPGWRPSAAGRGRGLRIARRAARAAGGRLTVSTGPDRVTAAVELPVEP